MSTDLKSFLFDDFTGGLVTNMASTNLKDNESPDLDNIKILSRGFLKREGDVAYNSTAMNSGADVQGLTYFKPTSGTEYLVAVCGNKIYDSDSFDGTMDDRTNGQTITANQNNLWTFSFLNDKCIAVGGAPNPPITLAGGAGAALLSADAKSGKFGFAMRDRMFIGGPTANPSTVYWSVLSDSSDWTGSGSGNNAAMTNDGDILTGGIALNNNIALLFKNYSIHKLIVESAPFPIKPLATDVGCVGKHAMVNVNGIVYFITREKRMKATDGYQIFSFPDSIDDIWDGLNSSRLEYIQGIYDPKNELIHWICSDSTSTTNDLDIMWSTRHKCWLRNTTGFACNAVCIASGNRMFGGHTDGVIYEKYKSSTYSDASVSTGVIDAYWRSPWLSFEDIFSKKQVRYADILCRSQTSGILKYGYGYSFNEDSTMGNFNQTTGGGQWGVDTWGETLIWGGQDYIQKRLYFFGIGNNFQLMLQNDVSGQAMEVNGFALAVRRSGQGDINRGA